jgi:signal transduction histidine kinase
VIRLVEPQSETGRAEPGTAAVARRALGADGVLMMELSPRGDQRLLDVDGLSPGEAAIALRTCVIGDRTADGRPLAVPGFRDVLHEQAVVPTAGAAAICALQRRGSGFKNAELAPSFARHAAIGRGMRQRGRQLDRSTAGDPEADMLGMWDLDRRGIEDFNRAVAEALDAAVGTKQFAVLLWDGELQLLRPVPGAFGSSAQELPPAHDAHDWGSSSARVFALREAYITNSARADPGVLQDHVEAFGIERLLEVPIDVGSQRVGVLQVANKPTDFTLRDACTAARLGSRIAIGARVARMRHTFLRRQRLEEILGDVAIDIASGRDLQDFLGSALDSLCAALAGSMILVAPIDAQPLIRRRGPERGYLDEMVLRQAREATGLRVYGVGPRRAGQPGWWAAHVPVLLGGEQVATLSALRTGGEEFDRDECRALSRLAHLVGLAWATEGYQRQLAESARVAERQRIADELHDQVAQLLFAARLSLDFALEMPDALDGPAMTNVQRGRDLLLRADDATRAVMERNSEASEDRLSARLAALAGSVEEEFGRPVALDIAPAADDAAGGFSRQAINLLARAAREALVNAAKHAGPCQLSVRVMVTRRHRLLLTVTDGGIGIGTRREDGYGTAALRRAVRRQGGAMRVIGVATGGTKVAVSLPL